MGVWPGKFDGGDVARQERDAAILIFRYFIRELVPQFFSALIVICSIIVVSQLVRLSEMLLNFGLSAENVFLPFLYIILPFISLTIPMAYLFAVVLTFGRLSADGEYAALLASGYALRRAAVPVLLVAGALYVAAATSAVYFEAWGRRELVQFFYRKTQTELDNMVRYKMQSGVFLDDFLGYVLYAERISQDRSTFENVMIAPGENSPNGNFTLLAPSGHLSGSVLTGNLKLSLDYGMAYSTSPSGGRTSVIKFKRAEIDLLRIFHEQILGADAAEDDFRSYRPMELKRFVDDLGANPQRDEGVYRRASFLFHQRIAWPIAVFSFALFGMVLGISDPRRGKSSAYVGAILAIILAYVLLMGFKWLAENGHQPAIVAAWLPGGVLTLIGLFLLFQKNRLPPSESAIAFSNLPLLGRLAQSRRP